MSHPVRDQPVRDLALEGSQLLLKAVAMFLGALALAGLLSS